MSIARSETLSSHIAAIYDCALQPDCWPSTLQALCVAVRGHSAGIVLLDYTGSNDRLVRDWGPTAVWGERMTEVFTSVKRIHRQFLGLQGSRLDEPIILPRDLAPQIDVFTTPFYQHWAAPQNIHQVAETVALSEPTRLGLFCITRRAENGPFEADEIQLLRSLSPHIRRAITISDLLDLRTVERQAFASVLDSLTAGICIVGADSIILHANRAAETMLADHQPICSEGGQLKAVAKRETDLLHEAIARTRDRTNLREPTGIGVPLQGRDGRRAIAHVLPLDTGHIRTRLVPDALAAVFVQPHEPASFPDMKTIAQAFGFTPMESEVVGILVRGTSLPEAANLLGVGQSTARSHLKSIFAKCNVSRQADLLALLERLTPMARQPS